MKDGDAEPEGSIWGWEDVLRICGTADTGSEEWQQAWRRISELPAAVLKTLVPLGIDSASQVYGPSFNRQALWNRANSVLVEIASSSDHFPTTAFLPHPLFDHIDSFSRLRPVDTPTITLSMLPFGAYSHTYPCPLTVPPSCPPAATDLPASAPSPTFHTVIVFGRPDSSAGPLSPSLSLVAGYLHTGDMSDVWTWALDVSHSAVTVFGHDLTETARSVVKQALKTGLQTLFPPTTSPPTTSPSKRRKTNAAPTGRRRSARHGGTTGAIQDEVQEPIEQGIIDRLVWQFTCLALPPAPPDFPPGFTPPLHFFEPSKQHIAAVLVFAVLTYLADVTLPFEGAGSLATIVTPSALKLDMEVAEPERVSRRAIQHQSLLLASQVIGGVQRRWAMFHRLRQNWTDMSEELESLARPTPDLFTPPILPRSLSPTPTRTLPPIVRVVKPSPPLTDYPSTPKLDPPIDSRSDPRHPRFPGLQPLSILNIPLHPSSLTFDLMRQGDEATGRAPLLGPRSRPMLVRGNIDTIGGSIPTDLTPLRIIELLKRNRMVKVQPMGTWEEKKAYTMALGRYYDQFTAGTAPGTLLDITANLNPILDQAIIPPRLAVELDCLRHNPSTCNKHASRVILFCPTGSFTNWHIDSSGAVGWTYIPEGTGGAKVWYFAEPTPDNIARLIEACSGGPCRPEDLSFPEVFAIEQRAGDVMWIPAGFIHAVYTSKATHMFGGEVMTSFDFPVQSRIWRFEAKMGYKVTEAYQSFIKTRYLEVRRFTTVFETAVAFAEEQHRGFHATLPSSIPEPDDLLQLITFLRDEMWSSLINTPKYHDEDDHDIRPTLLRMTRAAVISDIAFGTQREFQRGSGAGGG